MTVAEQITAEEALANTLEQYAGKWVAVRAHEVVAAADSLHELGTLLATEVGEEEVEVFEVASEPHAACFF